MFIRRHTKRFIDDFISQEIIDFIELREIFSNLTPHCSKIICKSFFICEEIITLLTHILGEIVFKESNFQAVFYEGLSFVIATNIEIFERSWECMIGVIENCPIWHAFSTEETTVKILVSIQENIDVILST